MPVGLAVLLALFIPFISSAQGQGGKLSGQIVDNNSKPVAYATVTLLKSDSTVANGDLTEEDGSFEIAPTGFGDFILRVNVIGFEEKYLGQIKITEAQPVRNLGKVTVAALSQTLNEVQITAERAMMEMNIDKKVFNVDKAITATGGSATDVLKNVPSLNVDVDGEVALRGKTATILIDGKPATLLGGDVASALQSLPASSIQSVEVITNPSAKYDAQGMTGIVNIITKKDRKMGLNGSASLGAGTGDKYNGSFNINLKNDKWNVFFNTNFRSNRNYHRTNNERWLNDGSLVSSSFEDNRRRFSGWFNTIGAEYTFNERNALTLTQNINMMQWGNNGETDFFFYSNGFRDSSQVRGTHNLGGPLSSSTSLDYKHKFAKPKQELTTNVTFARTQVDREQRFVTNFFDQNEAQKYNTVIQEAPGGGSNTSLNAQVDFTSPFLSKEGRFDAGLKSQVFWFESSNNAVVDSGAGFKADPYLQNDYNYNQQIHAAYVNFSDQRGKFGYQAGLRLEGSSYEGTSSLINDSTYSNKFLNLFPSAYVSYKLAELQTIYLSYTRRIDRPSFFRMMPYRDVSNPMEISVGNPNLVPEFIHNTELNYSRQFKKGHNIMWSLYYQYTQNLIDRIRTPIDSVRTLSMPANLNKGITYGFELTGKAQILPIWDAVLNFNFFQNEIYGSSAGTSLDNKGSSWFTKLNTSLKLPKDFSLQLSATYEAPKIEAQSRRDEVYFVDFAVRKNLFNNRANIVLNISDIFNTRKYSTWYDFPGSYQYVYRDRETRVANITFSYRFGTNEPRAMGRRGRQSGNTAPVKDRDNIKQGDDGEGF